MSFKHANDAAMGVSKYTRKALDFYPTPPWLARIGVENALDRIPMHSSVVWEPCAGDGAFAEVLKEFYEDVVCSDLHDYGYVSSIPGVDFLKASLPEGVTAIVTNPPYGDDAELFLRHALELVRPVNGQVMFLMRKEYDSAIRGKLFWNPPFCRKIDVCKRPLWIEGSTGSPRHNYSHYLFDWNWDRPATIRYVHPKHGTSELTLED